ncbi:hypothetical protein NBRC110019_02670 [Neptunitalea chrysea]|uniref:Membrane fusion protein, Cu(I)/Ag(I) efflux system n=1 Tax=Neptunitalea chrysea TaxID=1647581 RepID=A0A9W6B2M6_9FLAO|nr:efflux RND transporter periplasmic adaptor subunit [Neptunitalea chrysea]GLB51228.1 hypothetical protein NBRC110019_02670 [Neptunitalea chrysea]
MKKYISYILLLIVGIALGWLLFHTSTPNNNNNESHNHTNTEQLWTCSMHPQIIQNKPDDCPICGMELIPLEQNSNGLAPNQFKLSENAMALANIQTSIVDSTADNENGLNLSGTITENEKGNKTQISYFSGRIEKLYVNFEGQKIASGQQLATIYSPQLITAQQELLTAISLQESNPKLYNSVVKKLKLWKLSDSQIQTIETSGKIIEYFPVYATISGTILEKLVNEGDQVKQGQSLFKISNLNTVWANFDVYENNIKHIQKGQEIGIKTTAYPGENFSGKVTFINPVLNTTSRTITVRTELKNDKQLWKPGMFVEALIKTKNNKSTKKCYIPETAILWTGKRSVVYIKVNKQDPVFEMRNVTLGQKSGNTYEVLEGLQAGDEIVTNGTFTVDAAAQLQNKPSMMNQPSEKNATHDKEIDTIKRFEVSNMFMKQLNSLYTDYIALKTALVNDDFEKSKTYIQDIDESLAKVDMKLLKTAESHKVWMSTKKNINDAVSSFKKAETIAQQRDSFYIISQKMIQLIKAFGVQKQVFVQYCPMGNNNNGAFWLSNDNEIKNPYYGNAMLTCGNVAETIPE